MPTLVVGGGRSPRVPKTRTWFSPTCSNWTVLRSATTSLL